MISEDQTALPDIPVSNDCNYIAAFLTMACPYRCEYCINEFEPTRQFPPALSAKQWVRGLSRIKNLTRNRGVVPITFQGGEPSCHPGFYDIINELPETLSIDILTNLSFDVDEMIAKVDPDRLRRKAPYASIRVSYHPSQVSLDEIFKKTHKLQDAGFSIGLFGVLHPDQKETVLAALKRATDEEIDFRTKEFLGHIDGKLYGQYKYPDACTMTSKNQPAQVMCRTTELLIGSTGHIYRCHHDLYQQCEPVGHILDPDFQVNDIYRPCDCYGFCNPCDIKIKTNRLQEFGHTSVQIKFP